ncbi:MAG TPA: DUF4412 domain-containing protein [Bacteroidota bacterium]|nr:DUF4412 domain-containing protein [Bacteroidota bacterium]
MKSFFLFLAAVVLPAAAAHAQFEGTIRMRAVTYSGVDSSVVASTVYFRGKLFAATIDASGRTAGQGGKFILRGDKNLMWIVIDQEKKYMEIPLADKGRSADTARRTDTARSYTLTKTGKTRTLIGYSCGEWIADEGDGATAKIWATGKLGNMYEGVVKWFDEMSMESATDRSRWERELAGMKLFPLMVVRSEEGEVTEVEEVVAIEKTKVPDSMFEAPEGYAKQVVDLNFEKMFEEMMKQMEKEGEGADSTADEGDEGDDGGV